MTAYGYVLKRYTVLDVSTKRVLDENPKLVKKNYWTDFKERYFILIK